MSTSRVAIVGPGRVGTALGAAAAAAGCLVTAVAGGTPLRREQLAALVGATPVDTAPEIVADLVFLTVPDRALRPLAAELRAGGLDAPLVHAAGALPAAALGVERAGSFHPLRSFAGAPRPVPLAGIGVALDATDDGLVADLDTLARRLGMTPLHVQAADRARYHAAAALVGNASAALLDVARRQLVAIGIDDESAGAALAALLESVAANASELGIEAALSGPIRRGDVETVERHLEALEAGDPEAAEVYRLLGRLTLDLAGRGQDPPPAEAVRALRGALEDPHG